MAIGKANRSCEHDSPATGVKKQTHDFRKHREICPGACLCGNYKLRRGEWVIERICERFMYLHGDCALSGL
jgi:hypothetical protein